MNGDYDETKPDWRMYTNYHQNLVDQKVAYAVANPVTFGVDNDKALKQIQHTLNHKWDDKLVDILTAASNKGIEWVQPYVDEEESLKRFVYLQNKLYLFGLIKKEMNCKRLSVYMN